MSEEHPLIRNEVIDPLHTMLSNVIQGYLKKHQDMTNEELDCVFNRLLTFHDQQKIHLYVLYIWDLKKEEERLEELKAKKQNQYQ